MNEEIIPARFLVIRLSSIGDIVLTTPVVRCLKKQVPGSEIHYLTKKQYASLVKDNPYIDKVHLYDDNLSELVKELREEYFDYIIDLHHNIRSKLIKSRLGVLSFSFNKINLKKWMLVNLRINKLPDIHIVDRYLETLRLFDIENDKAGLDYFIPAADEVNVGKVLPGPFSSGYIALVTGAKHQTKQMPAEMMLALCRKLHYPVVLLGGKEDRDRAEQVMQGSDNCFNACGSFNLNQSASILRQALLVITPDTGLMHIAAALKKTIISVWGNTIPEFGMSPYYPGEESFLFEKKDLSCRPCSKLGYEACPKKHFKCMKELPVEEIAGLANCIAEKAGRN